jgi:hypothetical protein
MDEPGVGLRMILRDHVHLPHACTLPTIMQKDDEIAMTVEQNVCFKCVIDPF